MSSPHILVVDDEPEIRNTVKDILEDEGYSVSVAENAQSARECRIEQTPDLVFLDIWMPKEDGVSLLKDWKENEGMSTPVIMMSGHGSVETAVEATRIGAFDFIEKPLSLSKLVRVTTQALASYKSVRGQAESEQIIQPVGSSPQLKQLREQCERAARTETEILISGEPGSGKTMLARYIHANSNRSEQPFIEVSGAALTSENSAEQLFGGSGDEPGLLDQANGGTFFISEVSELDLQTQALLQSVLEKKSFVRGGSGESVNLDVRIISSTQHDLNQRISDDSFREDFYYLLNVVPLRVPALREHPEDIPELLNFYAEHYVNQQGMNYRHFTLAAQNYLRYYSWPGNVLQLNNLVQRLLAIGDGEEISQDEAEEALMSDRVALAQGGAIGLLDAVLDLPLREAREAFEKEYLIQHLEKCHGNVSRLAERVGMERTHLYRKMRALGVTPKKK